MTTARSSAGLRDPLTIVLPVYNETHRAAPNVLQLLAYVETLPEGSGLIFVDDGSTDGTAELLDKLLAEHDTTGCSRVVRRPHRGKGAATRAGILAATSALVGFCDIDLATPLTSFTEIALTAERAPVLAIGSRDLVGSKVLRHESSVREFLGRTYNRAVQSLVAPGIVDTQCGAKVARRELWNEVLIASIEDGFAWDVEVCGLVLAAGHPVIEIAIEWIHDDGSNINVARDGLRMVAALPRIRRTTRRFAAANSSRRTVRPWQERSAGALIVSMLRRGRVDSGPLIDLSGGTGDLSARLGWDPRSVVAVLRELPRRALPVGAVVGSLDEPPLRPAVAAAVVIRTPDVPDTQLASAASLLRPGGILVVLAAGADPRAMSGSVRNTGLRIEHSSHAYAWLRPGSLDRSAGRGALALTALERLALGRLGFRFPRGAAAIVVARKLAAS